MITSGCKVELLHLPLVSEGLGLGFFTNCPRPFTSSNYPLFSISQMIIQTTQPLPPSPLKMTQGPQLSWSID